MSSGKKEQFLEWLNRTTVFRDGQVQERPESERRGQGDLFADPSAPKFVFLQPIDYVIAGPCATYADDLRDPSFVKAPLGTFTLVKDGVRYEKTSALDEILKHNPDAKTIMVYADCCARYSDRFKKVFSELKPKITWIFPTVPDLSHNIHAEHNRLPFVRSLMSAGIIGIE